MSGSNFADASFLPPLWFLCPSVARLCLASRSSAAPPETVSGIDKGRLKLSSDQRFLSGRHCRGEGFDPAIPQGSSNCGARLLPKEYSNLPVLIKKRAAHFVQLNSEGMGDSPSAKFSRRWETGVVRRDTGSIVNPRNDENSANIRNPVQKKRVPYVDIPIALRKEQAGDVLRPRRRVS